MKKLSKMHGLPAMRVALLALCTAAMGATAMMAQDTPPAGPPPGQGRGPGGGMGNPERQLEMMTKQLNLTPDQVTQIKAIQEDGRKQAMAMRDDTAGPDRRAKMMAMRDAEQAKVKAVLTEDQKPKYETMLARQRERQANGGGYGGGNGNGAPPPPAASSAPGELASRTTSRPRPELLASFGLFAAPEPAADTNGYNRA